MIGLNLIRIELLGRRVDVCQIGVLAPVDHVVGGRRTDRPNTGGFLRFVLRGYCRKDPPVGSIRSGNFIPKRQVLRIESAVADDRLIAKQFDLNFWAYARVESVRNPDILKKMKKAGVNWLAYGIEAASETVRG